MHDQSFWVQTCAICGQKLLGDADSCCDDTVCQAVRDRQLSQEEATQEAESILENNWIEHTAKDLGL